MKKFEDSDIWQDALLTSKRIYKLTSQFPKSETFGLVAQMRRSVNSVSANFAEGFGRFSKKDKHHFYMIANGSLLETKSFIYLSVELGFVSSDSIGELLLDIESLQKRLNSLMKTHRSL